MRRVLCRTLACACFFLLHPTIGEAAPIGIEISSSTIETDLESDLTAVFQGTVTNDTGAPLATADIFLNFFGFDFTAIASIDQILGISDVVIDPGTTSPLLALFSVTLDSSAVPDVLYSVSAFAQDINDNFSDAFVVEVSREAVGTDPPNSVPEPATALLVLTGLSVAVYHRSRTGSSRRA